MGIQGLIPFLKKASHPANVREFSGCTVAVDAYCWLHKGAFSCADKLVKGEKTDGYVYYCMKYVNMLLSHNIHPILVFDGRNLPSKAGTEKKRRQARDNFRQMAREFLIQGNSQKARECFQRAVDVTPAMALEVMQACRSRGVDCIVAPYESDAQLAYLSRQGIAQLIITEDSDLVLFGCEKILFKMDLMGNGLLVERSKLHLSLGHQATAYTFDKFRHMAILSGCDYLPSLPGIGLARARKFITRTSNPDIYNALTKLPMQLNMPQIQMTKEYRDDFMRAEYTFLYQLVYDPLGQRLIPLNPYPGDLGPNDLKYAGEYLDATTAYQMALGNLNLNTLEKVADFDPEKSKITCQKGQKCSDPSKSVWARNYSVPAKKVEKPTVQFQQATTRGKEVHVSLPFKIKKASEQGPDNSTLAEAYGMESESSQKRKRDEYNDDEASPCSSADTGFEEVSEQFWMDVSQEMEQDFHSTPDSACDVSSLSSQEDNHLLKKSIIENVKVKTESVPNTPESPDLSTMSLGDGTEQKNTEDQESNPCKVPKVPKTLNPFARKRSLTNMITPKESTDEPEENQACDVRKTPKKLNPFAKAVTVTTATNRVPEKKPFSALFKFNKLRKTVVDLTNVVESQYFKVEEAPELEEVTEDSPNTEKSSPSPAKDEKQSPKKQLSPRKQHSPSKQKSPNKENKRELPMESDVGKTVVAATTRLGAFRWTTQFGFQKVKKRIGSCDGEDCPASNSGSLPVQSPSQKKTSSVQVKLAFPGPARCPGLSKKRRTSSQVTLGKERQTSLTDMFGYKNRRLSAS